MANTLNLTKLFSLMNSCLGSELGQFFSNFLATILAGLILYLCLEKKVREKIEKNEMKKIFENLIDELLFNHVLAEKIIKDRKKYMETDTFTLGKYRTKGLVTFYYTKPFGDEQKFPYTKLLGLIHKLDANNNLIRLVFSSQIPRVISINKLKVLGEAEMIIAKTAELLRDSEKFRKQFKLRNK